MEKAAFRLDGYYFTKASLDFDIPDKAELNIVFIPRGEFNSKDSTYKLDFDVKVECKDTEGGYFCFVCGFVFF